MYLERFEVSSCAIHLRPLGRSQVARQIGLKEAPKPQPQQREEERHRYGSISTRLKKRLRDPPERERGNIDKICAYMTSKNPAPLLNYRYPCIFKPTLLARLLFHNLIQSFKPSNVPTYLSAGTWAAFSLVA